MAVAERNYFLLREEYKIQMLEIFKEFTELPDKLKLIQLSILMNFEEKFEERFEERFEENFEERFENVLKSLPVDLVRISFRAYLQFLHHFEGEHHRCTRIRDTFAASCQRREKRLGQNLAGIWVSFLFLGPQGPFRLPLICFFLQFG